MYLNNQISVYRHIDPLQIAAFAAFKEGQRAYSAARLENRDVTEAELEAALGAPIQTVWNLFRRAAKLPMPETF